MEEIALKFDDLNEGKMVMEFKQLKQAGIYDDYVEKFEELRAYLLLSNSMNYSEEYFVASFISGLSEEMQGLMLLFRPRTLHEAIENGKQLLFTLEALSKRVRPSPKFVPAQGNNKRPDAALVHKPNAPNSSKTPIKLLTSAEMAARREKGLCYNCDEKYVFGHKCKHKVFYMAMDEEQELAHLQQGDEEAELIYENGGQMDEFYMTMDSLSTWYSKFHYYEGHRGISWKRVENTPRHWKYPQLLKRRNN